MRNFVLIILYATIIVLICLIIETRKKILPRRVYKINARFVKGEYRHLFPKKIHFCPYITNLRNTISRHNFQDYFLFLKIGEETKILTFSYVYHNIGYARMKMQGINIFVKIFMDYHNHIVILPIFKNFSKQKVKIEVIAKFKYNDELIYLTRNNYQKTTYLETKNVCASFRFFGLNTTFYKKDQEIGQVGKIDVKANQTEKVAVVLGCKKLGHLSIIELETLQHEIEVASTQFCQKYLTPKRKAIILHYVKKSCEYTFQIVGKEKYFIRKYFEDSFMKNGCDPYYPIFVAKKWDRDHMIVSKLLLDLGTNIQLIESPINGSRIDYETVMATNLNRPNIQLKRKSDWVVKDKIKKFQPLVLSTGIKVDEKAGLHQLDILSLYPKTYMYTTIKKNEIRNYMTRDVIRKNDTFFVKGELRDKSIRMEDFFILEIECDDPTLTMLVNDFLPKQIMKQYKENYSFISLYDFVFHHDVSMYYKDKYLENSLHLIQSKQFSKLYCYLVTSVLGVELVGDVIKSTCGASSLPYVKIQVKGTIIEKYQKENHCIIKCNQIMYQNVGVFKVKEKNKTT